MVTRIGTENETMLESKPPRIDLNRADEAVLRSLPGIGPELASRIIAYRDEHGPFLFEEEITLVDGISPILYEGLADRLTVTIPADDGLAGESQSSLAETFGRFSDNVAAKNATPPVTAADGTAEPPSIIEEMLVDEPEELPPAIAPAPSAPDTGEVVVPDDTGWELDVEKGPALRLNERAAVPTPGPAPEDAKPAKSEPAVKQRGRFALFWTALFGAALGGLLGLGLSMLVFAGINGSVDVDRSIAVRQVKGQIDELSVELDAVQGDVGILQGNVSGLRERVEVLSGLTARMEQAEETLATFTKEIQALAYETEALTSSLTDLSQNVDTMGETLDAVEAQTEKATTFFERLQQLLQEIFAEQLAEPESAVPQKAAPDLEVDA
ncbi:MAG: helix-hairpin-helix domain-containing protein [Anaerolineae bacterium]|nr:helix-hairpin-helix domain-containing protein [Anaerolineae bacterium]